MQSRCYGYKTTTPSLGGTRGFITGLLDPFNVGKLFDSLMTKKKKLLKLFLGKFMAEILSKQISSQNFINIHGLVLEQNFCGSCV